MTDKGNFMNVMTSADKGKRNARAGAKAGDGNEGWTIKTLCRLVVDNRWFSGSMTLLTIYALIGDDIRLGSTKQDADNVFDSLTITCLISFTLEIILQCIGKEDYAGGFFFWLDLLATASLLFDLTVVSEWIATGGGGGGEGNSDMARAGRAGRAGTKAGRIVRVLRLIRLIRILKLYKATVEMRRRKEQMAEQGIEDPMFDGEDDEDDELALKSGGESKVGRRLSDLTTRHVIMMVLAMMFGLQFLRVSVESFSHQSMTTGADRVTAKFARYYKECVKGTPMKEHLADQYKHELHYFLAVHNWFALWGPNPIDFTCPSSWCASDYLQHTVWMALEIGKGVNLNSTQQECLDPMFLKPVDNIHYFREEHGKNSYGMTYGFDTGDLEANFMNRLAKPWVITEKCKQHMAGNGNKPFLPEQLKRMKAIALVDDRADAPISMQSDWISCPSELRYNERRLIVGPRAWDFETELGIGTRFIFIADARPRTKYEALMNVVQTICVIFFLAMGAMAFSRDANILVLQPIERMIARVRQIAKDPLSANKISDDELRREQKMESHSTYVGGSVQGLWQKFKSLSQQKENEPLETALLEKTITKIGGLLALGFGEAGGNIIEQNMKGSTSASLSVIPGRKVDAVFGHCTVGCFTEAIEILQDSVMLFVNQIAEIIHGFVDEFLGAPNRNVGPSFLSVWRVPDDISAAQRDDTRRKLADIALLCFTKIFAATNRSPTLAEYRSHPGLIGHVGNFRVAVSFGLHFGWAIEGSIGSEFKIDASYLSPNVNLVMSVEEATEVYDVPIVMSETFAEATSSKLRGQFRALDHIQFAGTRENFTLYGFDLDILALEVLKPQRSKHTLNRYKKRMNREIRKRRKQQDNYDPAQVVLDDKDIQRLRAKYTNGDPSKPSRFYMSYEMAFWNYDAGEWEEARQMLLQTRSMLGSEDGPSVALLSFMAETDFKCPKEWQGYRKLAVSELAARMKAQRRGNAADLAGTGNSPGRAGGNCGNKRVCGGTKMFK